MRRLRIALGAVFVIVVALLAPATGTPQSNPNGPWVTPNQNESLAAIRDYGQLVKTLENVAASSKGAVRSPTPRSEPRGAGARSRS